MENEISNRRRFFNKLVGVAALGGIASLILGHKVERVKALDGSGAAGQIAWWQDGDTITGDSHLAWDASNNNFAAGWATVTSGVQDATISGGGASSKPNKVTDDYGTVGGGYNNQAGDNAGTDSDKPFATVGGGHSNTASGNCSTVGGGITNTASGNCSTVGGGDGNNASGTDSTVGGGASNIASGSSATVGGGGDNQATALDSTVPGGADNLAAGDYSFAAGRRARIAAAHDGAFLFADQNDYDFNSAAANEFAIRCTGGTRFVTAIDGSGNPSNGIYMKSPAKLGVGTSAPVDMVHVVAPAGQDANIRFEGGGNVTGFVLKNTGTGGRDWRIRVNKNTITPNGGLVFQDDSASPPTPRMVIDTSGNVGIGTSSPTQKLHVVGSVRATSGFITGDITYANGVKTTEEGDGLAFLNPEGEKIAVLDSEGNFHIKGKVMEDL